MMSKQGKMAVSYIAAAFMCLVATNVYALFGHGVRSMHMDLMFLHPLVGGLSLAFAAWLKPKLLKGAFFRLGFNIFNSGIACLTAGSFLNGIMEVAGTSSKHVFWFYLVGAILVAASLPPMFYKGRFKH